jgi:hypothetical protein
MFNKLVAPGSRWLETGLKIDEEMGFQYKAGFKWGSPSAQ